MKRRTSQGELKMMIPFGRRRLVISLVSAHGSSSAAATANLLLGDESDCELARLDARRRATLERAQWDIYSVTLQDPRLH
jgi:hypothetical protein